MTLMRDMEIIWEDLLEAFANSDDSIVYLLDRFTGEVFFVPADYEDESFWQEIDGHPEQFIGIPNFDYDQERLLAQEFIKGIENERLKQMLEMAFSGKTHGKFEEILSFYPEEYERYLLLKEELLAERIRHWLEEHDIFPSDGTF